MIPRIKEICKEKGVQFKDLANKLGISDVALRKQVYGNPTFETLNKIAAALNVETWELLTPSTNTAEFIAIIKSGNNYYYAPSIIELEKIIVQIKEKDSSV